MEINKKLKKRGWTFILYEDSCNPNWEQLLIDSHIEFAYAVHDKDTNPTGETKKLHTHVLIVFEGPTTWNNALEIAKECGCANGEIQPVGSIKGMIRYFTHKDNPEKYQYNDSIIQVRNGFNIDNFIELTLAQKKELKRLIIVFIQQKGILEYQELIDFLIEEDLEDMFEVASTNTIFINTYISSIRNKLKDLAKENEKLLTSK